MEENPKYKMLSIDSIQKMAECFATLDEATMFITHMDAVVREMSYLIDTRERSADADSPNVLLKQICTLLLFLRQNTELIQQLETAMKFEELSDQEIKRLEDEGEVKHL